MNREIFEFIIRDLNAQTIKVTGKVVSLEEKELELVSVKVKGSEDGVLTNAMGQFSINVKKSSILIFSSMGFKTLELMATQTPMLVTLSQSIDALDQVRTQHATNQVLPMFDIHLWQFLQRWKQV